METNFREVLVLRGIPGSGKSTFAKELVDKGWHRVNKDEIRYMINNYKLDNGDENMIHHIQSKIIRILMRNGKNIVVDNTHCKQKYVDDIESLVHYEQIMLDKDEIDYEYKVRTQVFDVPLQVCIDRNALRENPVPEEVIRKMFKQLF